MEALIAFIQLSIIGITFMISFLVSLYVTYFVWSRILGRHMANIGMGTLATGVALYQVKKFFTGKPGGKS